MPPKPAERRGTRSQSREEGLQLSWSRRLGGGVQDTLEVSFRPQVHQPGSPEVPADTVSPAATEEEVPVAAQVLEEQVEEGGDSRRQGSPASGPSRSRQDSQLSWDSIDLNSPLIGTDWTDADSIFQRFGIESIAGSEASESDCRQHYPHNSRSWSVSVNRLDRVDVQDLSPERRPRRQGSLPDLSNIEGISIE